MIKGPFGPCVWVLSAADVCVAEHDVAVLAYLFPPHTSEAFAQLGAQQACVRQVFDRHSDTVEVPPKAPWLHGTANLRELCQQLLRNIILGFEGVRHSMQAQPRLKGLLDTPTPHGAAFAGFAVVDVELLAVLDPVRDGYPAKHWMPDHIVIVESVGAGMQCGGDRVAGGHASASALFGMGT